MLSAGDDKYSALVLQEDPEAQQPWAYTVAAFKYAGGNIPQATPGTDAWHLLHLYGGAPALRLCLRLALHGSER